MNYQLSCLQTVSRINVSNLSGFRRAVSGYNVDNSPVTWLHIYRSTSAVPYLVCYRSHNLCFPLLFNFGKYKVKDEQYNYHNLKLRIHCLSQEALLLPSHFSDRHLILIKCQNWIVQFSSIWQMAWFAIFSIYI